MAFLAFVMGLQVGWRYFILWLGFQSDLGHWGWIVPWVQPLNASLLFLLLLAVGLTAYFHLRRMIPPDHGRGMDG
jgi:hypothetical protein